MILPPSYPPRSHLRPLPPPRLPLLRAIEPAPGWQACTSHFSSCSRARSGVVKTGRTLSAWSNPVNRLLLVNLGLSWSTDKPGQPRSNWSTWSNQPSLADPGQLVNWSNQSSLADPGQLVNLVKPSQPVVFADPNQPSQPCSTWPNVAGSGQASPVPVKPGQTWSNQVQVKPRCC